MFQEVEDFLVLFISYFDGSTLLFDFAEMSQTYSANTDP